MVKMSLLYLSCLMIWLSLFSGCCPECNEQVAGLKPGQVVVDKTELQRTMMQRDEFLKQLQDCLKGQNK